MPLQPDWIAPSVLSADFSNLGKEVKDVLNAGAHMVHFDVMDNHFVPNLTIGPLVCESLSNYMQKNQLNADIDVHLMVQPIDRMIRDFAQAGAQTITFHPEATESVEDSIKLVKSQQCQVGLVFNPETPLTILEDHLHNLDMIVIMSVNPGFAGQAFIPDALNKLATCRKLIDQSGRNIRLQIDGGVKTSNIAPIAQSGCDTFVLGSGIFSHRCTSDANPFEAVIQNLNQTIAQTRQR